MVGASGVFFSRSPRPSANSSAVAATAPRLRSAAARRRPPPRGGAVEPAASSAAVNSAAVAKRSPGSLANAFASTCSTDSGTSERRERSEGKGATTCLAITDWGVGPANGGSPPSIS
jgi:hypothetical protein